MKKMFLVVLFLILSFMNIIPSYAMSGKLDKIDIIYKTYNTNGTTSYNRNSSYRLYIDDILTYCITPGILFKQGDGYYEGDFNGISDDKVHQMELISYYGYGYKDNTDIKYYLATQELIHNLLGYTVIYNDGNFNVDDAKNEINELISKHNVLPTIEDNISLISDKEYTFIDNNNVLNEFEIEYSNNLQVSIENNVLKIKLLSGETGEIKFYKGTSEQTKFYLKDNSQTVADFKLSKELLKAINITKKPSGKIEVTDNHRATLEPIEGTKYNLLNESFQVLETKITDSNGYLIFDDNYEYGTYYVEEIEVKDYPKNEYLIIADLQSDLFTAPFFHGNFGSIIVKNVDKYGNPLNGKFEISSYDFYGMGFDNLIVGTYYIKQTEVEAGYTIDSNTYEIKITKENLNQELTIVNYQPTGSLIINNVNEEGNKLNGKFEVTDKEGKIVELNGLEIGTYYVKQIEVESGYIIDEQIYEIKIKLEDLNQELTLVNKKVTGSLTINNVNEEGDILNGKFEVTDKKGNLVDISKLYVGTYYVKQIEVEPGYIIDDETYKVEIKIEDLNKELTVVNKKVTGSLIINNINENGDKLNGKFEVTDKDGNKVDINKLYIGTYYIKQTEVKPGYIIDDETYKVEIKIEDLNKELTVVNKKVTGSLIINNINENGDKLSGKFEVTDEKGNLVDINKLYIGTYYIKQIEVESGYIIDEMVHEVEIELEDLNKVVNIINAKYEEILPKTSSNNGYILFISLIIMFIGIKIKRLNY